MHNSWWSALRRFMVPPILRAVDNDEPMDFLTEIRHVVVVFLNIITRTVTENVLIEVVDNAYKIVCCVTAETGGLVNKVSMFDKDMMFLMVFGLRGLKHEDEAQNALLCANQLKEHLNDVNITTVSVGVTSGSTYCGVVGHALRREYTVIGSAVNKGSRLAGKRRLMAECMNITPKFIETDQIVLTEKDKIPYQLIRLIMGRLFKGIGRTSRENRESRIRFTVDMTSLRPLEIHAINTIFDCRFPLPEHFAYDKDLLSEYQIRVLMENIFEASFKELRLVSVLEAEHIDDESWKMLLLILQFKICFVLLTVTDEDILSPVARYALNNHMIVKMHIAGIDRRYLSALACQLLDVQAIPSELDKVIESASDGLPGWIQNFLICLVQREQLTMVTVPRSQALDTGALIPPMSLIKKSDGKIRLPPDALGMRHNQNEANYSDNHQTDIIQMAVLSKYYNFEDVKVDMKMDVLILKTYDSLTPFEKMLLKCASVLGDVFSRRMLLHLLQCDEPRKIAQGDVNFLSEMHSRALLYLERYTRKCSSCGTGCFSVLFGLRCNDGLKTESEELKLTREQIRTLNAESKVSEGNIYSAIGNITEFGHIGRKHRNTLTESEADLRRVSRSIQIRKDTKIPSFSSVELNACECMSILLTAYSQAISHCRWAGDPEKLFDTYMEYADLCVLNANIPQAIHLLAEVEEKFTFRLCQRLENKARELCNRKRGHVDIVESHAVGYLYTNIFLYKYGSFFKNYPPFYISVSSVQRGKKLESLEFGLSVMRIMTDVSDTTTRESLIFWILKLLLTELRVQQMVTIMKEFIYYEHYDVSSEVWYHYNAMSIFLDTGYCVESYKTCETFYVHKGDMFPRSKTPEAGWNFCACMWLFTIRVGMWEKSVLWSDKIKLIQDMECTNHEYYTSMLLLVVEGYLVDLVREYWKRSLNPRLENYWSEHVESDTVLNYKEFEVEKGKKIIPYTLPLPQIFQ
ncbi:unnamed protein product [Leptosia nina]|uniref:Guanylate cyclase domain-containing protein n=1 Tax=Leptosia nina TaxID=320188 RepID=A0AAV1JX66_9NEOP